MNDSENAPREDKSKVQADFKQTKTDRAGGPELVDHPDAAGTRLRVKDRPLSTNHQQQAQRKRRRLSWRNIPWEFLILWSPLPVLFVLLITDPTAHHLIQAQFAKTNAQRIEQYTSALKIRKDPEVLVKRAWAQDSTDPKAEFSDLEEATQLGANSGTITWQMAMARANDKGTDSRTIDLLRESAKQSIKHFKAFPVDVTGDAASFCRAIYGLIACGQFKDAEKFLENPPHTFYGKGERIFFGALLKREAGNFEGATTDLSDANGQMHIIYYSEPACFQVLMALDAKDKKNASDWLDYLTAFKFRSSSWLTDYVAAWTALENGDLKRAHQKAAEVISYFAHGNPGIVGLNGIAASHLLEANIYAKQGRMEQATEEFAKFTECKNKGYTGRLLIPMPYREWIEAERPHGNSKN